MFWAQVTSHVAMILAYTGNPLANVMMEVLDILSGCVLAFPAVETQVTVDLVDVVVLLIILMDDPGNYRLLNFELAIIGFASHGSKTQEV